MEKKFRTLIAAAVLGAGASCHPPAAPSPVQEIREGGYRFISPLLECEPSPGELKLFHGKVGKHVDEVLAAKRATHVSVYFRDLTNGPWFGIRESERFSPASLLKVPLMMGVLRLAQRDPSVLQKKVYFDPAAPRSELAAMPDETVRPGGTYTVEELVESMISRSDNDAARLLIETLGGHVVSQTYADLGLPLPKTETEEDFLSVKDYASFFRILYNATYLNKEMSERALEFLARTRFGAALAAGLPAGVPIAHKYGTRRIGETKQLHDCGIVYAAQRPYLICVMTRGDDYAELSGVIAGVSRLVFDEVAAQSRR